MTDDLIKDIVQWDVKSWSKALSYWDKNINWDNIEHCLELGGREGGLSLWLALKQKSTICSDLHEVKKSAEKLHLKHKVTALIKYEDIDAGNIPYTNHFDVIIFKSILGGIGRNNNFELQQQVFKEIHKALKPGGKLLFAENLIASPVHQYFRKKFNRWGGYWRYINLEELTFFLENFSDYKMSTTGVLGTFGRSETQRNVLATIDELVLNKTCPENWKYIVYGIAEK